GARGAVHAGESAVGQGGVGGALDRKVGGLTDLEGEVRVVGAGLGDHGWVAVDAGDVRAAVGDGAGQMSGPAAEVEDPLTRLGSEQVDEVAAVLPDEGEVRIVAPGVPGRFGVGLPGRHVWPSLAPAVDRPGAVYLRPAVPRDLAPGWESAHSATRMRCRDAWGTPCAAQGRWGATKGGG